MRNQYQITSFTFFIFALLLFSHALAAYSVGGVPLQWGAQLGIVGLCFFIFVRDRVFLFPGFNSFLILLVWAMFITFMNNIMVDYSGMLGSMATTNYSIFIFLRFLGFMLFLSSILIVYWLCYNGLENKLIEVIVNIGTVVTAFALYIYLAHILGLPEPPRTRLGTGGCEAVTSYTYAFHRATGTFREPSHLAEWLVVPYFLSYIANKKLLNVKGLFMGGIILLTGSLTGVISVIGGFAVSLFLGLRFRFSELRAVYKMAIPIIGAFAIFSAVTAIKGTGDSDIVRVLWERVEPIIYDKGVHSTNRSYVYKYVEDEGAPLIGDGLGNANIKFGKYLGIEANVSFLNLFLNISFSTGIIGLLLLLGFIAYPIGLFVINKNHFRGSEAIFLCSAYIAWLFIFTMHSEELSLFFGVIYGLLVYHSTIGLRKENNEDN